MGNTQTVSETCSCGAKASYQGAYPNGYMAAWRNTHACTNRPKTAR